MRFPPHTSAIAANGDPLLNCDPIGNDSFNQLFWTLIHTIRDGGEGGNLADFDPADENTYNLLTKAINRVEVSIDEANENGYYTQHGVTTMFATSEPIHFRGDQRDIIFPRALKEVWGLPAFTIRVGGNANDDSRNDVMAQFRYWLTNAQGHITGVSIHAQGLGDDGFVGDWPRAQARVEGLLA